VSDTVSRGSHVCRTRGRGHERTPFTGGELFTSASVILQTSETARGASMVGAPLELRGPPAGPVALPAAPLSVAFERMKRKESV